MSDEKRIFAETPVRFDIAPAIQRDGMVHASFPHEGETIYILRYMAGDEVSFVCRRKGQFKITGEPPQ